MILSNSPPVAFITGASRGIGHDVAQGLAKDGFKIFAVARTKDPLQKLCDSINELRPESASFLVCDVEDSTAISAAVSETVSRFGRIDLLFNNAGINRQGTVDISHEDFDAQLGTNLRGAFNVLKCVVPVMQKQSSGHIINVASIAGKYGFATAGAYCATKFALLGLNEALFRELVPLGIKVTALCPSWVNTLMAKHGPMPGDKMIPTADILKTVRYLISLSPSTCLKEVVIECRYDIV